MSDEAKPTCRACGFPLEGYSGIRSFGTYQTHCERDCLSLMRARAEAAEAKVSAARLYAEDTMRRCEALEPVSAKNVAMAVLAALKDGESRDDD